MTSPTTVARAVARAAELRARAALDDVVAAHTALRDADAALAAATQAQAAAGPALVRAIAAARDVGITSEHLAELGITAPTSRTLRRRSQRPEPTPPPRTPHDPQGRTPHDPEGRTPDGPGSGHPVLAVVSSDSHREADTDSAVPWTQPADGPESGQGPDSDHHAHVAAVGA